LASSRRSGLAAAALLLLPVWLPAQARGPLVLAGRLVRVRGADTTALAGATVVAHRITPSRQGPIDSTRADPSGRFRFRFAADGDSTAVYVVSTRHQGIGYFSEPVSATARDGAGALALAVFDTSAAGPPLRVSVRHLVLTAPKEDGSRPVLDIIQVGNSGSTTRVAADSTVPTWTTRLPDGIAEFAVGESEVSASAVSYGNGMLSVTAPFPPGEKQVVVSYVVPRGARRLEIPMDQPTARLEVLVEDSNVTARGLRRAEPVTLEGRRFAHFVADTASAGAAPELRFGGAPGAGQRLWWIAVIAAALALVAGAVMALRRGGAARVPAAAPPLETLLAQLVALDERYEGREEGTPPLEWRRYQDRRAALKSQLAAVIAAE
jgi:hypothetical protein